MAYMNCTNLYIKYMEICYNVNAQVILNPNYNKLNQINSYNNSVIKI